MGRKCRDEHHEEFEAIVSVLARMRELMLKKYPEWLGAYVSDVLECALRLEQHQKELQEKAWKYDQLCK